ncbi:MAG: endo-1,4-beta-xylanase [Pseudomonadota bacterium]
MAGHSQPVEAQTRSLGAIAQARGFHYGCAISTDGIEDESFAEIVKRECTIVVAENAMKWRAIRPTPDTFDFTEADLFANFAETNGLVMRGHTLVWYRSLPDWFETFVDKTNAEQLLRDHIKEVVGRYAGRIHSWDVVNEATDPGGGRSDGLRESIFLDLIGEDYIKIAFEAAAEADPDTMLTYNDFWLPYNWSDEIARKKLIPQLLESHLSRGVPIHAFGLQGHLWAGRNDFDARGMRNLLREVADLGLQVMVTELDVRDQKLPSPDRVRDVFVADTYKRFLEIALEEDATIAVTTWGLSDRYTWLERSFPRNDGLPVRVLPYDRFLRPKPIVWNAFGEAFSSAPLR